MEEIVKEIPLQRVIDFGQPSEAFIERQKKEFEKASRELDYVFYLKEGNDNY